MLSAIQEDQMHFIVCIIRQGALKQQMAKMKINFQQNRYKNLK